MKMIWGILYKVFTWLSIGLIGFLLCVHDIEAGKLFILVLMILGAMLSVFLAFLFGSLYEDEISDSDENEVKVC